MVMSERGSPKRKKNLSNIDLLRLNCALEACFVAGFFSRFVGTTRHQLTVYLHFPCFDGVVSAALTSEVLRSRSGLQLNALVPVTYDLRGNWIQTRLQKPAADEECVKLGTDG